MRRGNRRVAESLDPRGRSGIAERVDQSLALEAILPETRREAAGGRGILAATDVRERGLQHIEHEIRAERYVRRDRWVRNPQLGGDVAEVVDHPSRGAEERDPAAGVEQKNLVEKAHHRGTRPVQGGDDDLVPGQRPQRFGDVLGVLGRKSRDRLVEQEDLGPAAEIQPEIQAAPLSAAQGFLARRTHPATGDRLQPEFREDTVGAASYFFRRQRGSPHGGGVPQVLSHRELRVQRLFLRHVGDEAYQFQAVLVERGIVEQYPTAAGFELPRQHRQQRALAAAAGPDDAQHFAAPGLESDVVQGPRPRNELVDQVLQPDRLDQVPFFIDDAFAEATAQGLGPGKADDRTLPQGHGGLHRDTIRGHAAFSFADEDVAGSPFQVEADSQHDPRGQSRSKQKVATF